MMRLLDQAKIPYRAYEYDPEAKDGNEVAKLVGKDPDSVFKTLIAVNNKREYFVFDIPVNATLDLKKAARASNSKSIEMLHQKDLLPLTGYVHGGCSPIGLKKPFPVFIEETAQLFDSICVSAGKRGYQVELSPLDLKDYVQASFASLTKD